MIRRFLALVAVVFALTIAAPAHAQSAGSTAAPKIAVVDFQAALEQVKEGVAAKTKIEAAYKEKAAALKVMEARLITMKDEYDKQAAILSDAARKQKESDMMNLQAQLQQAAMQSEQDMQNLYAQLNGGLITKMHDICEAIGKEKGYTVIIEINEGGVVYFAPTIDITAELIKRYDAAHGG